MANKREVTYARMHSTIFVPNAGQFGPELNSTSGTASKGINMTLEDGLVTCKLPHKNGKTILTVLIPVTNFTNLVVNEVALTDEKDS